MPKDEAVRVCVRIRPLFGKELQDGREVVAEAFKDRGEVHCRNPAADAREPPKTFTFDHVFPPDITQREVYDTCAVYIVESVMDGFNGTIFAYGQTGAGKTHTMEGKLDQPDLRGIIPNSFSHIFDRVAAEEGKKFLVRASYLEIYNEQIRDLLGRDPEGRLDLKENPDTGVYVKDLTSFVVQSATQIDQVMQAGKKNRSTGATAMNQESSRSHSIFTIVVECESLGIDGEDHVCVGKLNLVDLAGSERQSKTQATGDRLKEATNINLSLSALGNVISALVDGKSKHIPYRDSKLTRLLQDSLGGNTKTTMIANCGPADYNYDETLTTLRYANRAKSIKNKPRINEDPKDAMLRQMQEELTALRAQLAGDTVVVDGKEVARSQVKVERVVEEKVVVEHKTVVRTEGVTEAQLKQAEDMAAQEKQEAKRKYIAEQKERQKVLQQLERQKKEAEEALHGTREQREMKKKADAEAAQRIQQIQEQLLVGGKMMDRAAKDELELRRAKAELEERKRKEIEVARKMAEKESSMLVIEDRFSNMQEEVDVKTRKLKKLWEKFQTAKTEVADLKVENQRKREELLENVRDLTRQLQLKQLIIDHFVPADDTSKLEARGVWDDELEDWRLGPPRGCVLAARNPVVPGARRAEAEYARHRKRYDANPRFKQENIVSFELDMPERTTQDYSNSAMQQRVQEALTAALEGDEEDLQIDGPENLPSANF